MGVKEGFILSTEWAREDTEDQYRWCIPLTVHVNIQFVNIQQNTITVLVVQ